MSILMQYRSETLWIIDYTSTQEYVAYGFTASRSIEFGKTKARTSPGVIFGIFFKQHSGIGC